MRNALTWLLFVLMCLAAGIIGSVFTKLSVTTWYPGLLKPSGTPPAWVFGPVWTALYVLMGSAAWLVWRRAGWSRARIALALFVLQLALNVAWSLIFFGLRLPALALLEIVLLLAAIVATTLSFRQFSRVASWLMYPYLAWVMFATWLNFGIWRLN
jgi:benzodiazapine receptor